MTLRTLKAAAKHVGCTVVVHRDREKLEHEVLVSAPAGWVFRSSGVHQLVCAGSDGTPLDALYADAVERVQPGLEPCDEAECDCREV